MHAIVHLADVYFGMLGILYSPVGLAPARMATLYAQPSLATCVPPVNQVQGIGVSQCGDADTGRAESGCAAATIACRLSG